MIKYLISILLLISLIPAYANLMTLIPILKEKQGDEKLTAESIKEGDERALLCKYCHGADGNSLDTTIPNLADQNAMYLMRQFELFSNGERRNKTMNELSKILTDEEKVNIAMFYASKKVKLPVPYKPELKSEGLKVYKSKCIACHGKKAYGLVTIPRIASQPAEYLIKTLSSYRSILIKRADTLMTKVGQELEKDEIEAITSYLTSLK